MLRMLNMAAPPSAGAFPMNGPMQDSVGTVRDA
jgi:hypothetical protein